METQSQLISGQHTLAAFDETLLPQKIELRSGETLFSSEQGASGIYLLEQGCIKFGFRRSVPRGRVANDEFVTKLVSPGEYFALQALNLPATAAPISEELPLPTLVKKYFAQAASPAKLQFYPQATLDRMLRNSPPLVIKILQQALRDIQEYQTRSEVHHLATVEQKISAELLRLGKQFGVPRAEGLSINLSLTRNEIAQLADTINESMSRYLTRFQNRGWLEVRGREILLKNTAELSSLANAHS